MIQFYRTQPVTVGPEGSRRGYDISGRARSIRKVNWYREKISAVAHMGSNQKCKKMYFLSYRNAKLNKYPFA